MSPRSVRLTLWLAAFATLPVLYFLPEGESAPALRLAFLVRLDRLERSSRKRTHQRMSSIFAYFVHHILLEHRKCHNYYCSLEFACVDVRA